MFRCLSGRDLTLQTGVLGCEKSRFQFTALTRILFYFYFVVFVFLFIVRVSIYRPSILKICVCVYLHNICRLKYCIEYICRSTETRQPFVYLLINNTLVTYTSCICNLGTCESRMNIIT